MLLAASICKGRVDGYHTLSIRDVSYSEEGRIHLHRWDGLRRETPEAGLGISLVPPPGGGEHLPMTIDWTNRPGNNILFQAIEMHASRTAFLSLDASRVQGASMGVDLLCSFRKLHATVKMILGVYKSTIYFLSQRGWICSLNAATISTTKFYARHFFILPLWRTGRESIIRIVSKTSTALAHREDLVVFTIFWMGGRGCPLMTSK
jgi:hypothetical protein